MRLKNLTLLAMFLLMLAFSGTAVNAQSSATPAAASPQLEQQDADELKTQEQIVDELKLRRGQVTALTAEVTALKNQHALDVQIITFERERADFFKTATEARKGANEIDARIDFIRREQIEGYKLEITSLRDENAKLRSSRDKWRLGGTAAAAAAVIFARR